MPQSSIQENKLLGVCAPRPGVILPARQGPPNNSLIRIRDTFSENSAWPKLAQDVENAKARADVDSRLLRIVVAKTDHEECFAIRLHDNV